MEYPPQPAPAHSSAEAAAVAPPTHSAVCLSRRDLIARKAVIWAMQALVGMNDSAPGACLSAMQVTYSASYDKISLVFLANTAGFMLSCVSSSFIQHHLGLPTTLFLAAVSLGGGSLILSFAPPWSAFIVALVLLGWGLGTYETSLTTLVSHEEDEASMAISYAMFGLGASVAPLIVGTLVDREIGWQHYYLVPFAIAVILCLAGLVVFKGYEPPHDEPIPDSSSTTTVHARAKESVQQRMARALKMRAVWFGFLLTMLSFAFANILSAWVVSYLVQKRGAEQGSSRYMLSGVWGGIALGRVVLTYSLQRKLSERGYNLTILAVVAGCLGVIWAVRNVVADALLLCLVGVFLGPVTPQVLSAVSARVPASLKSSVMSLTIGLGLIGSSMGPLLFGLAAGKGELSALPAVLIVLALVSGVGWLGMPRNVRSRQD